VSARRARAPALVSALVLALAAAGCGGSGNTSAGQLRDAAGHACAAATQRLNAIPTPQVPSQGASFLRQGIAALQPELSTFSALHPGSDQRAQFRAARGATEDELKVLQSSLKGVKAGNDPIVVIKTLQAQLAPLEKRAKAAWQALGIPACATT
jgi:hypothetical protein